MTATIYHIEPQGGFNLARTTLRRPDATVEQIEAALEVLQHSGEWMDVVLVREMRMGLTAQRGAELRTAEALQAFDSHCASLSAIPSQHEQFPDFLAVVNDAISRIALLMAAAWAVGMIAAVIVIGGK